MREFNKNGQTWTAMRNNSRSVNDYVQMADRSGMKPKIGGGRQSVVALSIPRVVIL